MGFVGHGITQWIPNRYLRKFRVRFTGVTRPNDVITVTGKVVEKIEAKNLVVCTVEARDQKSEVKISGFFEAVFPAEDKSSS
jgi:acyl dehydratase